MPVIHEARLRERNDRPDRNGKYVLYWMDRSQRTATNHALEHAIREANDRDLGVVVFHGLGDEPGWTPRHHAFRLQGLKEVAESLAERRIKFVVRHGVAGDGALELAEDAALAVCDRGYLSHERRRRRTFGRDAGCPVVEVEADVVVPVETASDKAETAARTLRPKIEERRDEFLEGLSETRPVKDSRRLRVTGDVDLSKVERLLDRFDHEADVEPVRRFRGGTSQAKKRLASFLRHRLSGYAERRGEPADDDTSGLSPYLRFGQISPIEIALKVLDAKSGSRADKDALLEELIVRRELAVNHVFYEADYGKYGCLPEWARKTLAEHRDDEREHRYTRSELESSETHDPYWNAAMREMRCTGFLHNALRMYWGKKILEWSNTPEYAFRTTLTLNNRYFLDGGDPNSFANVAWCFGLHDRGWPEREVFGKIRYMNDRGLERKFDMEAYLEAVDRRVARERG